MLESMSVICFCQVVDYMACSVAYLSHIHSPA